jgi:transcriptional regulator with XRE-family HTH domain
LKKKKEKTQEEVADVFGVTGRTLRNWIKQPSEGGIKTVKRNATAYKVKAVHVDYMKTLLNKDKTIPLNELNQKIKEKYKDFDITVRQLGNIVRDDNITSKKLGVAHEPKTRYEKEINIQQELKEFYENVSKYSIEDIVCIDETSLNSYKKEMIVVRK